jgi:type I restriction enzyme M protein
LHLKEQGKEYRTLKLYGQELNLITSAIARMNMFMHNVDEFLVVQGDTLDSPQILENDELKKFDVIMANPPYSVKKWSQSQMDERPFWTQHLGNTTTRLCRLCFSAAHYEKPEP